MSEITKFMTTGAALGQFRKDLLASDVPVEVADSAVLIAAEALVHGGGELAVSKAVVA